MNIGEILFLDIARYVAIAEKYTIGFRDIRKIISIQNEVYDGPMGGVSGRFSRISNVQKGSFDREFPVRHDGTGTVHVRC